MGILSRGNSRMVAIVLDWDNIIYSQWYHIYNWLTANCLNEGRWEFSANAIGVGWNLGPLVMELCVLLMYI